MNFQEELVESSVESVGEVGRLFSRLCLVDAKLALVHLLSDFGKLEEKLEHLDLDPEDAVMSELEERIHLSL